MDCRGFTLLETLLAVSITLVCFSLFLPFLGTQRSIWERHTAIREEAETLAAAMQWITRDLQTAGYGWKGEPLLENGEKRLSFVVAAEDPNRHRDARSALRLVSIYENAGDLNYKVCRWDGDRGGWSRGSSHKLASDLVDIAFTGLGADGAPVSAPAAVRAVEVRLEGRLSGRHSGFAVLRNAAAGAEGAE